VSHCLPTVIEVGSILSPPPGMASSVSHPAHDHVHRPQYVTQRRTFNPSPKPECIADVNEVLQMCSEKSGRILDKAALNGRADVMVELLGFGVVLMLNNETRNGGKDETRK